MNYKQHSLSTISKSVRKYTRALLISSLNFFFFFFSLLKSELERKIRANDREYNLSFKYAVSIHWRSDSFCCSVWFFRELRCKPPHLTQGRHSLLFILRISHTHVQMFEADFV